jgi:hypothetical protein
MKTTIGSVFLLLVFVSCNSNSSKTANNIGKIKTDTIPDIIFYPIEKAASDTIVVEQQTDPVIAGIEAEFACKVQKAEDSGFDIQKYYKFTGIRIKKSDYIHVPDSDNIYGRIILFKKNVTGELGTFYSVPLPNLPSSLAYDNPDMDKSERELRKAFLPYAKKIINADADENFYSQSNDIERCEFGDINGDGEKDGIVTFCTNDGLLANITYYNAIFIKTKNGYEFLQYLGNGGFGWTNENYIKLSIKNGIIYGEESEYKEDDARCCPSFEVRTKYKLKGNKLVEIFREKVPK